MTEVALRTRRIHLVSGIMSIWGRTPATLAMTAATLHQVACGRYMLGLGASTRALTEGFHDRPFTRPAERLRDTIISVRALLDGEPARLEHGSPARPIRLSQPPLPDLPIWLAALGSRTIQSAVELADGWMPLFLTRERLLACRDELGPVREAAGARSKPLTVAAGPVVVVDQDAETARRVAGSLIAWYLCAMGDVYRRCVAAQRYAAAVQAMQSANPRPRPADGVVPPEADAVIDQFTAYGAAGQVREQLATWDTAVDIVMITPVPGLPWESLEATLRAAAPDEGSLVQAQGARVSQPPVERVSSDFTSVGI